MPDLTPAAELHAAVERLREHVGFLHLSDVRGPWSVHASPGGYPQSVNNIGVPIHVCSTYTDPKAPPVMANYIARMHPGVGRAVADWLEQTVRALEGGRIAIPAEALAVARAINTTQEQH